MNNSIAVPRRPSWWGRVVVVLHGLAVGCVLHVMCFLLFVRFKRGPEPATWIERVYDNDVVHGVVFTLMLLAGTSLAVFVPRWTGRDREAAVQQGAAAEDRYQAGDRG